MSAPASNSPDDGQILIRRVIHAPRELVFQAWSDPAHLARWYAPHGCTVEFQTYEFRPGGRIHSCIRNPQYPDCWCIGEFLEIISPEKIVQTSRLSDPEGRPLSSAEAGKASEWSEETTITISFRNLGGETELTLRQTVSESLARRTGAYPSWLQMLDRLEEILSCS